MLYFPLMGFMLFTLSYYVLSSVLLYLLRFPYEIMFGSSLSAINHWTARVFSFICLRILMSTRFDCISSNASVLQDAETTYPSLSLGINLVFIWIVNSWLHHRVSLTFFFRPNQFWKINHTYVLSNFRLRWRSQIICQRRWYLIKCTRHDSDITLINYTANKKERKAK